MTEPYVGSKKELAIALSRLAVFENPDVRLEQYPTDSEVAADILWRMHMQGEIAEKHIADLGCGTGILGIGALLLGARHVSFIDIDPAAQETLQKNLDTFEEFTLEHFDIICADVTRLPTLEEPADVVIMNPPFGTRDEHADLQFLTAALELAPLVYSMHKTTTIAYIEKWVSSNGAKVTAEHKYEFPIKQTFAHQTRKIVRIEVTCLRITRA